MTQLTKLNNFLIEIANADRVGIRRKILAVRKYLDNIGDIKSSCGRIFAEENHCTYENGGDTIDLAWNCFIDDIIMGAVWKREGDDGYWLIVSHEGDDHRVNESKWVEVFESITDNLPKENGKTKLFETPREVVEAMSVILKEKGL